MTRESSPTQKKEDEAYGDGSTGREASFAADSGGKPPHSTSARDAGRTRYMGGIASRNDAGHSMLCPYERQLDPHLTGVTRTNIVGRIGGGGMKSRILSVCLASVGALLAAGVPARAHHSFGVEYDVNKPVTLTGVITSIEWTNPHSFVYIDVKDASGKVTNWKFEGYPPGVLYRQGWKRDATMKTGDTITVMGWQARDGGAWGHARQITFADGKKLYFGPAPGTGDGGASPPVDVPPAN